MLSDSLTAQVGLTHTLDRLVYWLTAEWRCYWCWLTRWLRKIDWLTHWTCWLIEWLLNGIRTYIDWLADFTRLTDSHTGQVNSLTDCWMTFLLILIDSLTSQNGLTHTLDRLVYWLTAEWRSYWYWLTRWLRKMDWLTHWTGSYIDCAWLQNNAIFILFLNENIVNQYAKGPVLIPTIPINLENTTSKIMWPPISSWRQWPKYGSRVVFWNVAYRRVNIYLAMDNLRHNCGGNSLIRLRGFRFSWRRVWRWRTAFWDIAPKLSLK
jgi:hypothetical protein